MKLNPDVFLAAAEIVFRASRSRNSFDKYLAYCCHALEDALGEAHKQTPEGLWGYVKSIDSDYHVRFFERHFKPRILPSDATFCGWWGNDRVRRNTDSRIFALLLCKEMIESKNEPLV